MTLVGFRQRIEVNPPITRLSGFLKGADVRETDGHALLGAEYETDTCIKGVGGEWIDTCINLTGGHAQVPTGPQLGFKPTKVTTSKQFGDLDDLVAGDPFTTFAGVECDLISGDDENYLERSKRKFRYVESRQVDYHMARLITNHGNDLGDCPLSQMIMNADYTALNEYGSYPEIWMSAPLMVCAAASNLIFEQLDGRWRTVNGSWVNVIAHDDAVTDKNFFLTGYVTLLRGPEESRIGYDLQHNTRRALTERMYVPLIECMAYYATATCDMPITT
jgi:hypothetical protein